MPGFASVGGVKKASCVKLYLNHPGGATSLTAEYYENGRLVDSEVETQNMSFHGISYSYNPGSYCYTIKVLEANKFKLMRDSFFNSGLEAQDTTYTVVYNSGSIFVFFFNSDTASLKSCYDIMSKE